MWVVLMDSSTSQRRIIHIDCDCFFASVEQLDDPSLANHPMAVGGASARAVLTTANYAARAFGVHSAMPTWQAKKKCPQLIIKPVRMQRYQEVSRMVMAVLRSHCDAFEQVSVDEAYLDVSQYYQDYGSATELAKWLQKEVQEQTGISVSAGISHNKLLAKLASDFRKPGGTTTIAPDKSLQFLQPLSLKKLPGVGPKTYQKLADNGMYTCADAWSIDESVAMSLGNFAERLSQMSQGIDHRPVMAIRERKSVGVERTFNQDIATLAEIINTALSLVPAAHQRLAGKSFHHITVKLKFNNFQITSATASSHELNPEIISALCKTAWHRQTLPVRLIGLQCHLGDGPMQLPLAL